MSLLEQSVQLVTFEVGDRLFGVEISRIQEVIKYGDITPSLGSDPFIEGIIDLRGDIIPVVDLRKRFHLPIPEESRKNRILIAEIHEYIFGFIVDKVNEVCTYAMKDFHPPTLGSVEPDGEFTIGIGKKDGSLLTYLDIEQVVNFIPFPEEEEQNESETGHEFTE